MDRTAAAGRRGWWPAVLAVASHPTLWPTALRQAHRLAPRGWWRRSPFLPLPDPAYLAFRSETQYGSDRPPEPDDVVTYLRWCRSVQRST